MPHSEMQRKCHCWSGRWLRLAASVLSGWMVGPWSGRVPAGLLLLECGYEFLLFLVPSFLRPSGSPGWLNHGSHPFRSEGQSHPSMTYRERMGHMWCCGQRLSVRMIMCGSDVEFSVLGDILAVFVVPCSVGTPWCRIHNMLMLVVLQCRQFMLRYSPVPAAVLYSRSWLLRCRFLSHLGQLHRRRKDSHFVAHFVPNRSIRRSRTAVISAIL